MQGTQPLKGRTEKPAIGDIQGVQVSREITIASEASSCFPQMERKTPGEIISSNLAPKQPNQDTKNNSCQEKRSIQYHNRCHNRCRGRKQSWLSSPGRTAQTPYPSKCLAKNQINRLHTTYPHLPSSQYARTDYDK